MSESKPKWKFSKSKFIVRSAVGVGVLLGSGYLTAWFEALLPAPPPGGKPFMGDTETPLLWFEVRYWQSNRCILLLKWDKGTYHYANCRWWTGSRYQPDNHIQAPRLLREYRWFVYRRQHLYKQPAATLRELAATMREMLKNEVPKCWGQLAAELTKDGDRKWQSFPALRRRR